MANEKELEKLISLGDWDAVALAGAMGEAAWPAIKHGAAMENFEARQISMVCAGTLGGGSAGEILLAGLKDKHINVSLAAAGQLSKNPPAGALYGILDALAAYSEDSIGALLALAAGRLPGEASKKALLELVEGDDDVAENARLALAKLEHPEFLEAHLARLSSDDPHTRYEALAKLVYINDVKLAAHARGFLSDREAAVMIGTQYTPEYRRVCDQAVDTLVSLLQLKPPFETSVETIYSDEQLSQIMDMAR